MSEPLPIRSRPSLVGGNLLTLLAALAVLLLGAAALLSWQLDHSRPMRLGPRFPLLEYRFAFSCVLAGLGLALGTLERPRWTVACGVLLAGQSLWAAAETVGGFDLHLDRWLLPSGGQDLLLAPRHLPLGVALCWALVGIAVILMPPRAAFRQRPLLLMLLGAVVFGFGLAGFVRAATPFPTSSPWLHLPRFPLHTGLAFMAIALGLLDFGYRQRQRGEMPIHDLRNAIIIYTTFGMLLMIVVSAMLAIWPIYDRLCEAQQSYLVHAVRWRASQTEQYLARAEAIAQQITSRTRARKLLKAYEEGSLTQAECATQLQPLLEDALHGSREVQGITRLDRHGLPLISVGSAIPQSGWPSGTRPLDAPSIYGPVLAEGVAHLVIAAPIVDSQQSRLGTDLVLVVFQELADILADTEHSLTSSLVLADHEQGKTRTVSLGPTTGQVVLSSLPQAYRARLEAEPAGTAGLLPRETDDQGLLYAFAPVRKTNWFLISTLPADQLYYPVNRQLVLVVAAVGVFALLAAFGTFALLRPLTGGIVIQTDLLEHKIREATAALAESEERFQLAMRGTDAGIWDWDLRSDQVYYSPRWKSMLGYAEPEIGNSVSEWEGRLHPDDRALARETLQRFLSGATRSFELEHRLQHRDGSYRWILARALALRDPQGHPYRMVGSHIDVTDRKQAEERLQETAEALRRSNRDLEQFASIASHDLQEPLRMLSAYLDAISRQYREHLPTQAHALIDLSTQTGKRMQQLINDLLTYSRVSTGGAEFYPVNCQDALDEALRNLKLTLDEHAATVTQDELPVVLGDRTQVVQLFQNLVGNGIKFHGDTPPRVHVSAERRDGRWLLSVRDNGIGIAPEYAEAVFEIFQRLHNSEAYPGTGIGLAVCKRIIDRHQGRIWFESVVGQGTTFFFTLPALDAEGIPA